MAQLYRICLLMQETGLPSLIREDPTRRRPNQPSSTPTEPVLQSLGTAAPEPSRPSFGSPRVPEPVLHEKSHHPRSKQ